MPFLIFRQRLSALFKVLSEHVVLCAEEMLHEELHAFGRAADEVGAPDEEHLRTVLTGIEVLGSQ